MAQGDILRLSNGNIALNATGKVRLLDASSDCPDCCTSCTDSATSCTHCSAGATPTAFTVVFSGINLCTSCIENADSTFDMKVSWAGSDVINTTHTITQNTACNWTKTMAYAIDVDTGAPGSGSCTTNYNEDLIISLTKTNSTTFILTVYFLADGGSVLFQLFEDTVTVAANDCELDAEVFTNEQTAGGSSYDCGDEVPSGGGYVAGTDGTGTVTCQ